MDVNRADSRAQASANRGFKAATGAALFGIACLMLQIVQSKAQSEPGKTVVAGYIEWAQLDRQPFLIRAKLDTGAKSSSINAFNIARFEKDRQPWVRFSVANRNGRELQFERPIVRIARIRRANTPVKERVVVRISICIAGKSGEADVTLADRTGMNYAMLIGRSFLGGRILVDSNAEYTGNDGCKKP